MHHGHDLTPDADRLRTNASDPAVSEVGSAVSGDAAVKTGSARRPVESLHLLDRGPVCDLVSSWE